MALQAFKSRNIEASRSAHTDLDIQLRDHHEEHSLVGGHIKSIVYGGLDGIITTFAVVAGATGGHLDSSVILILGVANLWADALSMGAGDALSCRAENEMVLREREREQWEMKNYPEGEISEMIEVYSKRGLTKEAAEIVVRAMATNPEFFVDQMVVDELHLTLPDDDDSPWVNGLVTFMSFVFFGIFPLLAYILLDSSSASDETMFTISCILTAVMLFVLGVVKSHFTNQSWYYAGGEILVLGGLTAAVSYGIGNIVSKVGSVPSHPTTQCLQLYEP
jgi:VIT1/CCC1 family predicted Fe2+/Mn2+ transporter